MIEVEKKDWKNEGRVEHFIKGTHILHREDGPAIVYKNNGKAWYINGVLHREDGPALINDDGNIEWWLNGKRHRDDGPALIRSDGKIFWYLNNILFTKKEEWFESLTEGQKAKAIYSDYFIGG